MESIDKGKEIVVCCHACDELCRIGRSDRSGRFNCPNCGYLLFKHKEGSVVKMYTLGLAALILLILTNYFPFLSFDVAGNISEANFLTSVGYLFEEHQYLIGIAVLMTTLVVPTIRIIMILALFGPLHYGYLPGYASFVLKILYHSSPWGMLDVFLVGVFVSMVKLVKMGTVIPGISLWAFMILVFVIAAMQVAYNPHSVWEQIDAKREKGVCI